MKSPDKSLPTEAAASSGNAPDLQVPENSSSAAESQSGAPTQTPPSLSAEDTAFGAAVWQTNQRVNGLYNTKDAHNSWMSITGKGWVKLTTTSDSACEAMTILAANARVKNSRIDYAVDGGLATEIYVY